MTDRPYRRVPALTDRRRPFAITLGQVAGYTLLGGVLPPTFAINAALDWMANRITNGQPYLTGLFTHGTLAYGWATDGLPETLTEQALTFHGDLSVLHAAMIPDGHVIEMLDELAGRLGNSLQQTRVYVSYCDRAWVLECDREPAPSAPELDGALANRIEQALESGLVLDALIVAMNTAYLANPQGTLRYLRERFNIEWPGPGAPLVVPGVTT